MSQGQQKSENRASDQGTIPNPPTPAQKTPSDNFYDENFKWNDEDPWLGTAVDFGYVSMTKPAPPRGKPQNQGWYFMYVCPNPDAPVLVSSIGGPGYAIATKIFNRYNPLRINIEERCLEQNPDSITDRYHLIYLDAPVGAGFSTCLPETKVPSYKILGENACEVFEEIFKKHPALATADFFFNGESFSGLSLPAITHALISAFSIKFKGAILGNPPFSHPPNWQFLTHIKNFLTFIGISIFLTFIGIAIFLTFIGIAIFTTFIGIAIFTTLIGIAIFTTLIGIAIFTTLMTISIFYPI